MAPGKDCATLADLRLISVWKTQDHFVDAGGLRRLNDRLVSPSLKTGDIGCDRI